MVNNGASGQELHLEYPVDGEFQNGVWSRHSRRRMPMTRSMNGWDIGT